MSDLISSGFWGNVSTHVACAPGERAEGLSEFMEAELGRRGWCLFQTSGTEGIRKWVALTKESLLVSAVAVNAHFEITHEDRWLLALPLWHVGGFGVVARAHAAGSEVVRMATRWNAEQFANLAAQTGATLASLVPTQVFDLVTAGILAPKAMRAVLVGGAALSPQVEKSALELGWPVRRTYGMTETCSQVASQRVAGAEMEVLPIWQLQTDEAGVLTIRGSALAMGYASCRQGKWHWEPIFAESGLRTRDRVNVTEEGSRRFLRFTGRQAGIVKALGELVSLDHVQQQVDALRLKLGLHAGDAVIVDVPDERAGVQLVLAVSGMSAQDTERLKNSVNKTLRGFERVSHARMFVEIPRGELGKPRFGELRRRLEGGG